MGEELMIIRARRRFKLPGLEDLQETTLPLSSKRVALLFFMQSTACVSS